MTMKYLDFKKVKYIVIHCSATLPGQPCNARIIDEWHQKRGFNMIGYHYVVLPDGEVETGRPLFYQGAHVGRPTNYNDMSIGVCYVGGLDAHGRFADTRTEAQKDSLMSLLRKLKKKFPQARIVGHNYLNAGKACPCFDAQVYNLSTLSSC